MTFIAFRLHNAFDAKKRAHAPTRTQIVCVRSALRVLVQYLMCLHAYTFISSRAAEIVHTKPPCTMCVN